MKKKILISLGCIMACLLVAGQVKTSPKSVHTQINIAVKDFRNYNFYCLRNAGQKIYEAVMANKLQAYQDSSLSKKWDAKKLEKDLYTSEHIRVQTDPNDPYMTVDTVVYTAPIGRDFYQISIHYTSLGQRAVGIHEWTSPFRARYFVAYDDALKVLDDEEQLLLSMFLNMAPAYHYTLNDSTLRKLSDTLRYRLDAAMYAPAKAGKMTTYHTDTIDRIFVLKQLERALTRCWVISVPIDPKDPYNTLDSVICIPLGTQDMKGISIYDEYVNTGYNTSFNIKAIGPCYQYSYGPYSTKPVVFPLQPAFYLMWDAKTISLFSAEEQQYLQGLIRYARIRQMDPEQLMDEREAR